VRQLPSRYVWRTPNLTWTNYGAEGSIKIAVSALPVHRSEGIQMTSWQGRFQVVISALLLWGLQGCATMLQPVASTGLIVHARGASQHTATVQLALPPGEVFAGMLRVAARHPEFRVVNKVQSRFLLEVKDGTRRLTGQATDLGGGKTLLFMWTDAGGSGQTGRELALDAVKEICTELAVQCRMGEI
jgi:hypothetical protein